MKGRCRLDEGGLPATADETPSAAAGWPDWARQAGDFLLRQWRSGDGCAPSVPGGAPTLYGTCYAHQGWWYLGGSVNLRPSTAEFVLDAQDASTGLFIGPELKDYEAKPGILHDRQHLLLHSTSMAIPFCQEFGLSIRHPLHAIHPFCDPGYLRQWAERRDWKNAWFEGNNILFIGQLLVYLRDVERHPEAGRALQWWFEWLDGLMDPRTGLWGTDGHCGAMQAVYGGYHQLLVYYHEGKPVRHLENLVDTVLGLQHRDGGFHPGGNGGACEDVDCVDILVHCYKRHPHRRADVRHALKRCLAHILATQNKDGGFPYNRDAPQSHMGIPGTAAAPNVSCLFPTWFRIHTLALIAEILPAHPALCGIGFRFNRFLGMGWHASPAGWLAGGEASRWEDVLASVRWYSRRGTRKGLTMLKRLIGWRSRFP